MFSKKLNPFKVFQSDQMQRSSRKIFTAHYARRNAALNWTPVKGTTNGFIFQIVNSLIESWGVRLTCFDCKRGIILGGCEDYHYEEKLESYLYWSSFEPSTVNVNQIWPNRIVICFVSLSKCPHG